MDDSESIAVPDLIDLPTLNRTCIYSFLLYLVSIDICLQKMVIFNRILTTDSDNHIMLAHSKHFRDLRIRNYDATATQRFNYTGEALD